MKKKIGSLIMAGLMTAVMAVGSLSLVGCNDSKISDFEMPKDGYDGSKVTISFYHTMGQDLRKVLTSYIGKFNQLYPNITIKDSPVGNYDDVRKKIATEITAGKQPNIAYCYPDHVALYNNSASVFPMDELIESKIVEERADGTKETIGLTAEQKENFISGYYEEGRQFGDNKMYTLPFSKSNEVLYYNKTFFDNSLYLYENEYVTYDSNGKLITNPEQEVAKTDENKNPHYQDINYNLFVPKTWDEMETVCERILAMKRAESPDGKAGITPFGYDSEANWFITMCEQYGSPYTSASGEHYLFDNETNRAFVTKFAAWYLKGYFTTQEILEKYTSTLFKEQKSYMSIGSSAGATKQAPDRVNNVYPFEVGIAPIPQVNPDKPKVISQGPSVCIFKKKNPQEVIASWLFIKFLTTSSSFQAQFSDVSGYVPVLKSVVEEPVYKESLEKANGYDGIAYLSVKVCMEQVDAYYTSPAFLGSSKARDQVGLLMQAVFTESKTVDQAFKDAIAECRF